MQAFTVDTDVGVIRIVFGLMSPRLAQAISFQCRGMNVTASREMHINRQDNQFLSPQSVLIVPRFILALILISITPWCVVGQDNARHSMATIDKLIANLADATQSSETRLQNPTASDPGDVASSANRLVRPAAQSVIVTKESSDTSQTAKGVRSFSLNELEGMAFQHNPTLSQALARMESSRGTQVQASLYPNPVVGYHATEIGNLGTAGQQGAFFSQRLITAGKLGLDHAIAGKDVDEAHFRFHLQEQRVLSDVRMRFYDAQLAQQRFKLTTELMRIGERLVNSTKKLIAGRQGTENDLLQAEIKADESFILCDNARNQQIEAWRRLVAVVGVPDLAMSPLSGEFDGDLPSFDWESCYAMVLDGHPSLKVARVRLERAVVMIQRARREPIPNVDLMFSNRKHNVTRDHVSNIQIGIPIPIFNRNQGNIRSAEAQWMAARDEIKRIELDLQDRLAIAYRQYANSRQRVDRYKDRMVPKAKRSLQLVTLGYEKGQVEYLTLLTAQQTYLRVSLSYLDSLRELRSAAAFIDGQLLSGSLTVQH